MAVYNVHGGHSLVCRGAAGLLDEVNEDRKVKNRVIELLRAAGHTVYDCTDDTGATQNENLAAIVKKCNVHQVALDISIHLNSGRNDSAGDDSTGGVEVYGYDAGTQEIGTAICSGIAAALNLNNRGFKINTGLYVLRSTKSPAILIECAFVDDKDDADRWDADRCADAIVKALIGSVPSNATVANHKYAVGQEVSYRTSYKNPTDSCGYEAAVGGSGHGRIIAIVSGQAKYRLDSGVFCNDGDIIGLYTQVSQKNPTIPNVYYKAYAGGKWYSEEASIASGDNVSVVARTKVKTRIVAMRNGIRLYWKVTVY